MIDKKITIYEKYLPDCAKEIRQIVFEKEQGFTDEFDETDETATHFVAHDEDGKPVGVCRLFYDETRGSYILGRLAVLREYRSRHIGAELIRAAEQYARSLGGSSICLHAQCQAAEFYHKQGYAAFAKPDEEQGCPHIWLRKDLPAQEDAVGMD